MKILLIANSSWNIYNFRVPLIQHFQEHGWDVEVMAAEDGYTSKLKEEYGIEVFPLKNGAALRKGPQHWWALFRELKATIKALKPDCLLTFTLVPNILGGFVAKKLQIPFLPTLTGLGYTFLHSGLTQYFATAFYKSALKKAFAVAFHNPDDLELFLQKGIIKKDQGLVIPGSGIQVEGYQPQKRTIPSARTLLFVGRLLHDKGLVELVEACKRLWDQGFTFQLKIVGEKDARNPAAIQEKVLQQWNRMENLEMTGKVESIQPVLQSADIFILPSYREGLPKSTLEAMAMALPIITTDVPGCRSTVWEGKNGWLIPSKNISALEKAIKRALELPYPTLETMGRHSRQLAIENFSMKTVISSYQQLISTLSETSSHDHSKSEA